jgi:hypothetical protein
MQRIFDYPGTFKDFASEIAAAVPPKNSESFLSGMILKEAQRILPKEISLDSLENQLAACPLISYADHLGLLNYKLLYNSNLLYAEIIKQLQLPYVVVFASGSIPMVNRSHPRGFYFKGRKFNFFGEKQCKLPVFLFQGKLDSDRKKGIPGICISYDKELLSEEEKIFLEFLFYDGLDMENVSKIDGTFSDQITFLNFKLWKYYFDKAIRDSVPGIIYLQSNRIISDFLIHEIKKEDSLISLILFDRGVRRLYLKNFMEIPCCWGENLGSQLFWGVIERRDKTRLIPLQVDDSSQTLVGENFTVKLEREVITDALQSKKILQTSFFDLLLVTFLEGYLTLGGFNQVEYLKQMQTAHVKTLREIGMTEGANRFAARVTNGLVCGMFPFHFDSGIDLIWHYNSHNGRFNGNLNGGLTQRELDQMLAVKVKDMILQAAAAMLENI